jgi:hypothetical protein
VKYEPRPIDTSSVVLPDSIEPLAEKLAESAHDVWAVQRMSEGWTLGPKRDDGKKKHPCLVPYKKLPESEKVYDRNAAIQTLKAIMALGFRIERARKKT